MSLIFYSAGTSADSFASVDLASRFQVQFAGCSLSQMSVAFNLNSMLLKRDKA